MTKTASAGAKGGTDRRLLARIARALFKSFLYKDLAVLDRIDWHGPQQIDALGDDYMQQVCGFFRSLPHA